MSRPSEQIERDKETVKAFYHHQEICPACSLSIRTMGNTQSCRKGAELALRYLEYRSRMPGGRQAEMMLEWIRSLP